MGFMKKRCYLCGSELRLFAEKNGYRILECVSCGLGQTEFVDNYEPFLADFYAKGYYSGDVKCGAYAQYFRDKKYITRNLIKQLKQVEKYKKNGKLLDVGCAVGYMVELALSRGFDAYGFDPSAYAISKVSGKVKNRVTKASISTYNAKPQDFDVIIMHDVFEHLEDPVKSLKKMLVFLKPGGVILIATGDKNSLIARIMGWRWTFYSPPQHLFFFSKNHILKIFEQTGLKPLKFYKVGKWLSLDYILHLAESSVKMAFANDIRKLVRKAGLQTLPVYLPLRDNISVIAVKK